MDQSYFQDAAVTEVMPASSGLSQQSTNGKARAAALQALQQQTVTTTSVIEYTSRGRLVIIGAAQEAVPLAEQLLEQLTAVAIVDPASVNQRPVLDDRIFYIAAPVAKVTGHLGDFTILLHDAGQQTLSLKALLGRAWPQIDMVLDLSVPPCFDAQISPPGYFAPRGDVQQLRNCVAEIPVMVGEFEKPRYFKYDPAICVHARNHKTACTRCIDACPTLAIHSLGERIEVDPYLCQGGGSCAAVCPSGAMQYVYPDLADTLGRIRRVLQVYHQSGGKQARLVFIEAASLDAVYQSLNGQAENLLPLAMDELGALDLAVLLNSLAYGARQVIVLTSAQTPARIRQSLQEQQQLATAFLQGMGYAAAQIVICNEEQLATLPDAVESVLPLAAYASFNDKRTMINFALEHLYQHATQQMKILPLSAAAPFGEINIDGQTCTLCLACTGVCPTGALLAGNDAPQLKFIEDNCVQCGLCEQTCPEQAIQRTPRYVFDSELRRNRRVLHEEPAFHCIECGKPFATRKVIEHMQAKLAGHWMFGNERAMRRLQMCENCRVADMWQEQGVG